jgi:hypothetical protein
VRTERPLSAALLVALALSGAGMPAGTAPADARRAEELHSRTEAPAPTVTRAIDKGFDLGSAALGAGGAAAVLLLTAAGTSAVSHRQRKTRERCT